MSRMETAITEVKAHRPFSLSKTLLLTASLAVVVFIGLLFALSFLRVSASEKASEILNSPIILTLIGAVVASWLAKAANEKVGTDVRNEQVKDLFEALRLAVRLTRRDYDKFRDEYGRIGKYADEAKEQAIQYIKDILGVERYSNIINDVGFRFLDKAIDEYVASEWQERFSVEKEQVKDLVGIAANTVPEAAEWKRLRNVEGQKIIDIAYSNLQELMDGVGLQGWGKNILVAFIQAELNKRVQPPMSYSS